MRMEKADNYVNQFLLQKFKKGLSVIDRGRSLFRLHRDLNRLKLGKDESKTFHPERLSYRAVPEIPV